MSAISIKGVKKRYGKTQFVVHGVDLSMMRHPVLEPAPTAL